MQTNLKQMPLAEQPVSIITEFGFSFQIKIHTIIK